MKIMRVGVAFAAVILAAASGWGQAIQFINVTRQAAYVQQGALVGDLVADPTTPFVFRAAVEGDNATTGSNPLTAVTFTPPGGSVTPLTYDSNGHQWRFVDNTQTSMDNLNGVYGTGGYAFDLTGTPNGTPSVTVGSFASTQLQIPLLTLSGGSWVGSSYQITTAATLTIAFNAVYTGGVGGTAAFHYDAEINGNSYNNSVNDFINYDPTTSSAAANASTPPNFVVSPLSAGNYTIQVSYDDVQNPASGTYASAFSASLLEYRTSLSLTVIPEPAAYAAMLGAVALGGVMLRHRRNTALN